MSNSIDDRVLALAGLIQALAQVRRIADTGQAESHPVQTALDSVFRIDAPDTVAVYGSVGDLRDGLRLLRNYLTSGRKDDALPRLALAVLQLERRFIRADGIVSKVQAGLRQLAVKAQTQGSTHPDVIAALARLYADTLSTLRPRVMVQGNPHYLGQASVVAEIRALLLAALRSAVLWRQLGGSLWDFLLRRREMVAAIDAQLA